MQAAGRLPRSGKLISSPEWRRRISTYGSLTTNAAFALFNIALGAWQASVWFVTIGCYYLALAAMRALVALAWLGRRRTTGTQQACRELRVMRATGGIMTAMTIVLAGITLLTIVRGPGAAWNQIVVITQATYTFVMMGVAIRGYAKGVREGALGRTLASINGVSALVSLLSLQTIMVDTFGGGAGFRLIVSAGLGAAVCTCCLAAGISLLAGKPEKPAR